jgi:hypothetical protein
MKKSLLIIPFLLFHFMAFSQWRKVERLSKDKTPNLKLSSWTNLNFQYPGVILGGEFMVRRKKVTLKNFERTKEKYLAVNLYYFAEADLKRAAALNVSWLKRTFYKQSGIFSDFNVGGSFGRDATTRPITYVKNPDGTESVKTATKNFVMINLALGVGYDFMPQKDIPLKVFTQVGLAPIYDFNWPLQTVYKLEIGVITPLSVFKKK